MHLDDILLALNLPYRFLAGRGDPLVTYLSIALLPAKRVQSNRIFIGSADIVYPWLKQLPPEAAVTVFVIGEDKLPADFTPSAGITIIACDGTLSQTANRLMNVLSLYDKLAVLSANAHSQENLEMILTCLSVIYRCHVLFLNSNFQLEAYALSDFFHSEGAQEFIDHVDDCEKLYKNLMDNSTNNTHEYFESDQVDEAHHAYVFRNMHKGAGISRIILILPKERANPALRSAMDRSVQFVHRYWQRHWMTFLDAAFTAFLGDIFSFPPPSADEMQRFIAKAAIPFDKSYTIFVIKDIPGHASSRISLVIPNLKIIFKSNYCCYFRNRYYLLVPDYQAEKHGYMLQSAEHLAKEHHLCICEGLSSQSLMELRALYMQTVSILDWIQQQNLPGHLFHVKDHYLDYVIQTFLRHTEEDGARYDQILYTPEFLKLRASDENLGTDYCIILQKYYENDMNLSQTAKALYMHRNTLLRKVNQIEELIGKPLSTPDLSMALRMCLYIQKHLHHDQKSLEASSRPSMMDFYPPALF